MVERQAHGFANEKSIISHHGLQDANLRKDVYYTSKWDAFYGDIPCSIKTIKKGSSIDLGDITRQKTISQDFLLFVSFWEGQKDNIVENHILYVSSDYWRKQFPKECEDMMNPKIVFNNITNQKEDDERWKIRTNSYRKRWRQYETIISIRFKRDHKKQKRIQCAIKNKEFYNVLLPKYGITELPSQ